MKDNPSTPFYSPWPLVPRRGPRGRRRDIVELSYLQHLEIILNPFISRIIGPSRVSVLEKSPREHIVDLAKSQARIPYPTRKYIQQLRTEVPPGHVRVRFFLKIDAMRGFRAKPDLEAVLPLETNGELDLKKVKRLWGLETCAPVDPVRWKVVELGRPELLSPLAVNSLLEFYGAINVIEPSVCEETLKKREVRDNLRPQIEAVRPRVDALMRRVEKCINDTNLADCYDKAQQDVRYFDWCLKQWMAELSPWQQLLLIMIFVAMVIFFLFVTVMRPRPDKVAVRVRWAKDGLNLTDVLP